MDLVTHARSVIAADLATLAIRRAVHSGEVDWNDYPKLAEEDYNQVLAEVLLIAANSTPNQDEVGYAKALLASRANTED
jgi:hypothetical protein